MSFKKPKGGNVVIWQIDMYTKKAKQQLENNDFYVMLPSNPTEIFKKKLDLLLEKATQLDIITKQENKCMTVDTPIIPTFYMLPKVYKSLQEPQGRLIISGIRGLNKKVCLYTTFCFIVDIRHTSFYNLTR